jgi:hypothetical protein
MYLENDVDKNMLIFFRGPVMIKEKDERLLEKLCYPMKSYYRK